MERQFKQGEHVCAVYQSAVERDALVALYLAEGIGCGEQCLYGALTAADASAARAQLRRRGVDVAAAEQRGALVMLTSESTHLVGGHFDSERMLRMLNDATEAALESGFSGFRACGDMTWLADEPPGSEQVFAYEAFLSSMFERQCALGLCLYDRRRLPSSVLDYALATHPAARVEAGTVVNPFYQPVLSSRRASGEDVDWKLQALRARSI